MKKKLLAILLTACMLMTMLPSVAFAVDETGGAVTTAEALQAALDTAKSGDTILVADGEYDVAYKDDNHQATWHYLLLNKEGITLKAQNQGKATLNATALTDSKGNILKNGAQQQSTVTIAASNVVLDGFVINPITGYDNKVVEVHPSYYAVKNTTKTNGTITKGFEMVTNDVDNVTIKNCTINSDSSSIYIGDVNKVDENHVGSYHVEDNTCSSQIVVTNGAGNAMTDNTATIAGNTVPFIAISGTANTAWNLKEIDKYPTISGNTLIGSTKIINGKEYTMYVRGNSKDTSKLPNDDFYNNIVTNNTIDAEVEINGEVVGDSNAEVNTYPYYSNYKMLTAKYVYPVSIGTTGYTTLAEAVAAAQVGATITLGADITIHSVLTIDKDITLDINGKTLTLNSGSAEAQARLIKVNEGKSLNITGNGTIEGTNEAAYGLIDNYGTVIAQKITFKDCGTGDGASIKNRLTSSNLTLTDCTMVGTGVVTGNANVYNDGSMTIAGGTYTCASERAYSIISNSGTATLKGVTVNGIHGGIAIDSGSMEVNGGTYTTKEYYAFWITNNGKEDTTVEVNDGVFTGKAYGLYALVDDDKQDKADVSVTIKGGSYTGETAAVKCGDTRPTTHKWEFSITGGYFTTDPSAYVATGKVATPGTYKGGYNYKVEEKLAETLKSVSAKVYNGEAEVESEEVTATIDGTTVKLAGMISAGNCIKLTYTGTYGTVYTTSGGASDFKIGDTIYKIVNEVSELAANVAVVKPESEVKLEANASTTEDEKKFADEVVSALENTGKPTATGLANQVTNATLGTDDDGNVTIPTENGGTITVGKAIGEVITKVSEDKNAPENLKGKNADELTVVVQPVINVSVKEVESSGDDGQSMDMESMTLNITATSKTFVTDKDTAENVAKGETTLNTNNALSVGSETKVAVNDPLTITFGLPSTFAGDSNTLFADHEHTNTTTNKTTSEVVPVTVTNNGTAYVGTFTLMGLSDVKIVKDARTANIFFADSDKAVVYNRSNATETFPTATAPSGKNFAGWSFAGVEGTYTAMSDNLLTTLAGNAVTATAVFSDVPSGGGSSSSTYYTITATAGTGGSISPSGSLSVREGLDKTYTITPNTGYIISNVLVDGVSVGAVSTYTFTNLQKGHTISVTFKAETSNHFTDVSENDWFYDEVMNAVAHGWFVGTSNTTFSPNAPTTRGAIVTVLHRMDGKPAATVASVFEDVASGAFYANGVTWAQANGIVNGYDNSKFGPNDNITREQMAAILYRYAAFKGYDVTATTSLDTFTDAASVSGFAVDPMKWAVANGLISGKGNGILDPKGSATRAQLAAILTRFDQKFAEE